MTKYLRCGSGLFTLLICVSVQAQFYTVSFVNPSIDTLYKSKDPFAHRSDSVDFDAAMMVQARAKGTCSDFAERSPSSRFLIAKLGRKLTASNYCQKKRCCNRNICLFYSKSITKYYKRCNCKKIGECCRHCL